MGGFSTVISNRTRRGSLRAAQAGGHASPVVSVGAHTAVPVTVPALVRTAHVRRAVRRKEVTP